jgi:hypothetical protein
MEEDMADETYLVMANGTPDAATKVVEVREDKGERIIFRSPKYFAEGYPWHAGMGVYAKTKELAYEEQEMGRHKPGFAVVPKLVLEDLVRGARNVKLVGKVSSTAPTAPPLHHSRNLKSQSQRCPKSVFPQRNRPSPRNTPANSAAARAARVSPKRAISPTSKASTSRA